MRLKVCGIRSIEEAYELRDIAEIHYFGLIFAKSKRQVSLDKAKEISRIFHEANKKTVGVFVNSEIDEVKKIREYCSLDVIQLHGNETALFCENLGGKVWKSFLVENKIPDISKYDRVIEYPLFDAKGAGHGGNGICFDWNLLKNVNHSFILAGGISVSNIWQVWGCSPDIIDLNSKFEKDDRKNKTLILQAIDTLKDL